MQYLLYLFMYICTFMYTYVYTHNSLAHILNYIY